MSEFQSLQSLLDDDECSDLGFSVATEAKGKIALGEKTGPHERGMPPARTRDGTAAIRVTYI